MCLRQPKVLTKSTLKSSSLRVSFFSEELDMPPPFSDVQKVVTRCPQILWLDMDVFMKPNCKILKEQLELNKEGVKKLLLFFPAIMCYNPVTLQRACRQALAMLTGKISHILSTHMHHRDPHRDSMNIFYCINTPLSSHRLKYTVTIRGFKAFAFLHVDGGEHFVHRFFAIFCHVL